MHRLGFAGQCRESAIHASFLVGRDLVGPREQLGVDPVAHNQPINTVLARMSTLVTSDAQHGQLADDVTECDRAFAGHHSHPSTRNARSIRALTLRDVRRVATNRVRRSRVDRRP